MTLRDHLDQFYSKYNIPEKGGVDDRTFEVPLPIFTLRLPNFSWRKKMLYIHDLEHILNNQDTTWQGEMFVASWEISTGFFKNFPILIFPLWTMGWGLWVNPSTVYRAFKKGHTDKGIARLNIDQNQLLDFDLAKLHQLTINQRISRRKFSFWLRFPLWGLTSQLVFLFPVIALVGVLSIFLKYLI